MHVLQIQYKEVKPLGIVKKSYLYEFMISMYFMFKKTHFNVGIFE